MQLVSKQTLLWLMSLVLLVLPLVVLAVKVSNVANNGVVLTFFHGSLQGVDGTISVMITLQPKRLSNLDLVTELLTLLVGIVRVFLANILCRLCTLSLEKPLIPLSCCWRGHRSPVP